MQNTTEQHFNLEAEFDEQVKPLIDALYDKLNELGMPGLIGVCYKKEDSNIGFASSINLPAKISPVHLIASHFIFEEVVPVEIVRLVLRTGFAATNGQEIEVSEIRVDNDEPEITVH